MVLLSPSISHHANMKPGESFVVLRLFIEDLAVYWVGLAFICR